MASLPSNLHGFPLVAVKREVEDPDFHLHQFPIVRQEGMVASPTVNGSISWSRARGFDALQHLGSGLPTPYCNAVFQQNTAHIHGHPSSTLSGAHPAAALLHLASNNLSEPHPYICSFGFQDPIFSSHHPATPIGGRANYNYAECLELFSLKLTHDNMPNLNCLIIPTESAERFFPDSPSLMFWDQKSRRWWSFEYFRSRDRQCHQLVSGWSSFVQEKALKMGDTLVFSLFMNNQILQSSYYMIDVRRTLKLFGSVINID